MSLPLPIQPLSHSCPACRTKLVRFGHYFRKNDRALVQRYRCPRCAKCFSDSFFSPCYLQKKRHLNELIFRLLTGGYSQRRLAFDFHLNRKTVVRKFLFLGKAATALLPQLTLHGKKVQHLQFDELETFEHSKCKPLSAVIAVEHKSRRILGFRVGEMPAKGKLAALARKRYGHRRDQRRQVRAELFAELMPSIETDAVIMSDRNPHYPEDVKRHFPHATHRTCKGRRGCVVGQGELKRGGHDPLFSLNHTYAMLRANVNRLFRRTWCTTKKKERLALHIALYAINHNLRLIA